MRFGQRWFDLAATITGLLVIWPLLLVVALLVKLGDGGPVLFRQVRVGHRGREFRINKFRTMVVNAEVQGPQLTVGHDQRITWVGRWLRRTKLDEFPQLFNVIAGDMGLVGPRPEVPRYVAMYDPDQRRVLELRPGITDPASIRFADEGTLLAQAVDPEREYVTRIMPEKIRMNLAYAERASLWTDLVIILKTIFRFRGHGP